MEIKPGGTQGGSVEFMWAIGLLLAGAAAYFFFDSVNVNTHGSGVISGAMRGGGHHGGGGHRMWQTTSMGIIFLPFFIGVIGLFVDVNYKWAWGLLWIGLGIIVVEILSRLRFDFQMKTSHLLLIITTFAAGVGIMIRSLKAQRDYGKADKK